MALCNAKTRGGGTCQKHALIGSNRCKLHGGKSTGAPAKNQNARTHGIYSSYLSDEEKDVWDQVKLGEVDDELRLTRIRLMRALKAENERGNTLEIDSEKVETGENGGTVTTTKVRDYSSLIDRLTGRIESLERTRAELLKNNPPSDLPVALIEIEVVGGRTDATAQDD